MTARPMNDRESVGHSIRVGNPNAELSIQFFDLPNDLLGHQLIWKSASESIPLLSSIESAEHSGIACPAFQQLVKENHDGTNVLLTVGQSHNHHWSAAISGSQNPQTLEFEMACRINRDHGIPGSLYQLLNQFRIISSSQRRLVFEVGEQVFSLIAKQDSRIESDESGLVSIAPDVTLSRLPTTAVWNFSIVVE